MLRPLLGVALLALPASASGHPDFAYVLVQPDGQTMSGSTSDLKEAVRLKSKVDGPYLWIRQGEKRYVITDQGLLDQAGELAEPQRKLGRKQGELGAQQADLGQRQGRLGMEQARLGLAEASSALRERDEDERASAREKRSETRARERDLAEEQRELGRAQGVIGREQKKMGREQVRLAHEMQDKMRSLLDDALKRGLARSLD